MTRRTDDFLSSTFGFSPTPRGPSVSSPLDLGNRSWAPDPFNPFQQEMQQAPPAPVPPPAPPEAQQFLMEQPQDPRGFWQRFQETPGMGLGLMQLGAGLASGKNWGEGIGAGFSGMADTLQKQSVIEDEKAYKDAYLRAKAASKTSGKVGTPYQFTRADGTKVNGFFDVDPETGRRTAVDAATGEAIGDFTSFDTLRADPTNKDSIKSTLFLGQDAQGRPVRGFQGMRDGKPVWLAEDMQTVIEGARNMTPYKEPDTVRPGDAFSKTSFNIRYRDPQTGMEMVRAARMNNGEYEAQDGEGNWKPAYQVAKSPFTVTGRGEQQDVEEGAGGVPNATFYNPETSTPTFQFTREGDGKNYGYALRMVGANQQINSIVQDKETFNELATIGGAVRRWAANNSDQALTATALSAALKDQGYSEGDAARLLQSPAFSFLQGLLRSDTGAAYTGKEIDTYWASFLPTTGDTEAQWYQKSDARNRAIAELIGKAGPASPYLTELQAGVRKLPGTVPIMPLRERKTAPVTPQPAQAGTINYDEIDKALGL